MSDLYPTDGSSFYTPPEDELNKQAIEEERKATLQAAPFLDDMMQWFDDRMAECDSIALAVETSKERNISLEAAMHALDIVRLTLEGKKMELSNLKLNLKTD